MAAEQQQFHERHHQTAGSGGRHIDSERRNGFRIASQLQADRCLLGTGNRGQYVGKIFADDPRAQVTAMCDIDPVKIDQAKTRMPAASGAKVFRDAAEMFAAGGFDAVYIATPVYLHPEHFEMAVRAGVHIYCEKPAGRAWPV